jgi:hypothetical protein
MKALTSSLILFLTILFQAPGFAQELPEPSPRSTLEQRVGVTDITIDYSRPGVKDRQIFGSLVPYDKMWRTGANKATSIEFSKPVRIGNNEVPAGKYSLFTIPTQDEWTVILNKKTELWGTNGYKKKHDLLRFEVKPEDLPEKRERMTFLISDITRNSAKIELEWADRRISFPIEMDTDKHSMENIQSTLSELPGKYASSARYTLRANKHYEKGLEWVNTSIQLDEGWYNNWIKGELLMRMERYEEAYDAMKQAKKLGDKAESFFYEDKVKERLKKLEGKVGG